MAAMPSNQCFGVIHVKSLLMNRNVIMVNFFQRSLIGKFLRTLKPANSHSSDHFLFHCPFKEGYFSSMELEMDVRVHLQEMSAYRRLKM